MKVKNLLIIIFFVPYLIFSQTEQEMFYAGIKTGTVKTIHKKFEGNISSAINKWADTGNGKLSKKFIVSAEKLGLNKVYLESKLKLGRKVRLQIGVMSTLAIAGGIASGLSGVPANNYTPYYENPKYKFSKKKKNKVYDMRSLPKIDSRYFNPLSVDNTFTNQSSFNNEYIENLNNSSINNYGDVYNNTAPLFMGSSSTYVDGINQMNTGYDDIGMLNIYDASGITVGAIKDEKDGFGVYQNGILKSFTSRPDNDGVSTTYVGGIPVSAQKKDSDGNISYYNNGIASGYSKKVRGGYENYDKSGHLTSFTATNKKNN